MKAKYPAKSNAVRTKMLTVCKGCGKPNKNGYQYCTACHQKNQQARRIPKATVKTTKPKQGVQVSAKTEPKVKTKTTTVISREEILKAVGQEGTL